MTDFAQIQKLVELFNPKVNDTKSDTEDDVLDEASVSTNNETNIVDNSEQRTGTDNDIKFYIIIR